MDPKVKFPWISKKQYILFPISLILYTTWGLGPTSSTCVQVGSQSQVQEHSVGSQVVEIWSFYMSTINNYKIAILQFCSYVCTTLLVALWHLKSSFNFWLSGLWCLVLSRLLQMWGIYFPHCLSIRWIHCQVIGLEEGVLAETMKMYMNKSIFIWPIAQTYAKYASPIILCPWYEDQIISIRGTEWVENVKRVWWVSMDC